LDENGISIITEVNARKNVLQAEDIPQLIREIDLLYVASGKKVVEYIPGKVVEGDLIAKVCGRSGNLRAPTMKVGRTLYVGYNLALYEIICN